MRQSLTSVGACMPGSMLLFLDANVLFAAAWSPDQRSALLFDLGRGGPHGQQRRCPGGGGA